MKISRPIRARIAPTAILQNYRLAKQKSPTAKAWAVIKANAYGHGQWRAVEALRDVADGFALLECENAVALREAGIRQPILLLEGIFSSRDVRAVVEQGISTVIHGPEQLELLLKTAPSDAAIAVWLKLNTGMNRLGFRPQAALAMAQRLRALPQVRLTTLMTHFATADDERGIAGQMARFQPVAAALGLPVSVANSAAILRHDSARAEFIRPGIMLYGCSPFAGETGEQLGLRPTMTLEADIIGVQTLQAGDEVGYGARFTAPGPMRIGVVACGYADGYPRIVPSGTPVRVDGQASGTVGRVSMDMLAVDLTHLPAAGIGSKVVLWGEGVAIETVADAAGTIGYELMCAVAPRVPLVEVGS